jgi:hypothetical protein
MYVQLASIMSSNSSDTPEHDDEDEFSTDFDSSVNGDEWEGNENETFDKFAVSAAKLASSNPLKKVERKSNTKPQSQDGFHAFKVKVRQHLERIISITHCF